MATDQVETEAIAEAKEEPFDPMAHMGKIRTRQGMQKYLSVKWRVLWVRKKHPGASIVTEKVDGGLEAGWVEFKCTVTLPDGTVAVDYGSETREDFPDYYEKASTKATGRALALAGFGTDAAPDLDDDEPLDGLPAAKHERRDRRKAYDEDHSDGDPEPRPAPQLSPDPSAPSTQAQRMALMRMSTSGFAVMEYIETHFSKDTMEKLTFSEAAEAIRAGNSQRGQQ